MRELAAILTAIAIGTGIGAWVLFKLGPWLTLMLFWYGLMGNPQF